MSVTVQIPPPLPSYCAQRMAALLLGLVGCASVGAAGAPRPEEAVEVHRTRYGVVHVVADTHFALAYGLAHAYARDNLCLLADHVVTVSGERSRHFGAEGRTTVGLREFDNLTSDRFFRFYLDDATLQAAYGEVPPEVRALIRGYVAGHNRFLADHAGARLPAACRDAPWLRPLTETDMLRLLEERAVLASGSALLDAIVAAAPPRAGARTTTPVRPPRPADASLGSNGWAFGAERTAHRGGLVLANPHFPWETINRFYQVHLTLRGRFDVMGVTLPPFPAVVIGFTRDVAWTHTVSTAKRFTLFELTLAPDDPLVYVVDGVRHRMRKHPVRIEVREPDGRIRIDTHVFHASEHGPIVVLADAGLGWSERRAYALRDVNRGNRDMLGTWLGIARARSVAGIERTLSESLGIPWLNTIAADARGEVLFADLSRAPDVTQERLASCRPSQEAQAAAARADLVVLDGARAACRWYAEQGRGAWLAPRELPVVRRRDYVANSNDSYWLVNARHRSAPLAPILGPTAVPQRLRTRIGLEEIEAHAGRLGTREVEAMLFSNRNHSGELFAADLLELCEEPGRVELSSGRTIELAGACAAVAGWDRRSELDSRGAALFREFWQRVRTLENLHAVPFDARDPIGTPRGLNLADPAVRARLRVALGEAAELLERNGFAADVPLGEVQGVVRNGRRIPIHGGDWHDGVLNLNLTRPLTPQGYEPYDGASYIQIVALGPDGPEARAVLAYSQSSDPDSPHHADQTWLYSRRQLYRLPFTAREIERDPAHVLERLSVGVPREMP